MSSLVSKPAVRTLVALMLAASPLAAWASSDIFVCQDADGRKTYQNTGGGRGCFRLDVQPALSVPAPRQQAALAGEGKQGFGDRVADIAADRREDVLDGGEASLGVIERVGAAQRFGVGRLEDGLAVLESLKAGHSIDLPVYDFVAYTRSPETIRVEPKSIILVEGILIFAEPKLRTLFNMKLFVDADPDLCFIRRLQRDIIALLANRGVAGAQLVGERFRGTRSVAAMA